MLVAQAVSAEVASAADSVDRSAQVQVIVHSSTLMLTAGAGGCSGPAEALAVVH